MGFLKKIGAHSLSFLDILQSIARGCTLATSDYHKQKRASGKKRWRKIKTCATQYMWMGFMMVLLLNGTSATLADIPINNVTGQYSAWKTNIQAAATSIHFSGTATDKNTTPVDSTTIKVPLAQHNKYIIDIRAYAVEAYVSGEEVEDNFMEFATQTDHACPDN